ncbi:MAG: carboxyl transferase domain-containing protein [Thermodesulfobacteriota bacterium]|nr:carboxyl transferase domain-containing protein [Thermodesulfobacteriota bacterium]
METAMKNALERLHKIQEENLLGGGQKWIDRQRSLGKLLARERIECFVDEGTFVELGSAVEATSMRIDGKIIHSPCDGAIIGHGSVEGRQVAVYASDFTVQAGSAAQQHMVKFDKLWDFAGKWGIPMVWLLDSAGGRLGQDDIAAAGVEWFFWYESRYSGVVPQICVLLGPCIAGQAYAPCLTDFLLMSRGTAHLWLGGPRMTAAATSEKMDDVVGSGDYHMIHSGTCDAVGEDDRDTIAMARKLLGYLPSNFRENPPVVRTDDKPLREIPDLVDIVPADLSKNYDMHDVIERLVDDGDYFEIKDEYAKQLITCLCRFNGQAVGLVASNPVEPGSILECNACDKYYRFLEVLDAYNIPLVNLIDTPPYVPGDEEEEKGLLRHGGKIIHLYANATIPKISVILRQSYGDAGSIILGGVKGMGGDLCYSWPIATIGVSSSNLDLRNAYGGGIEDDAYDRYLNRPREKLDVFDVARTATAQVVDEIINPVDTRRKIIRALELTKNKMERLPLKAKAHGTPPT